jgi:hypothetical protein
VSLADGFLTTAKYLARRNSNKPTGEDVRRCISTAYYALFHRLIDASVGRLLPTPEQQAALARSFDHGRMKGVCQAVRKQPVPPLVSAHLGVPPPRHWNALPRRSRRSSKPGTGPTTTGRPR